MFAVDIVFGLVHKLNQLSGRWYLVESGKFPDNADLVASVPGLFIVMLRLIKLILYWLYDSVIMHHIRVNYVFSYLFIALIFDFIGRCYENLHLIFLQFYSQYMMQRKEGYSQI